jgi:K+-sensing histidine kinase KdpD
VRIDRDRLRLYALAILCGAIAEVGLVLTIKQTGADGLALLFFVEAIILGLVFGARPGMVAAVLPFAALYPVALMVDDIAEPVSLLSYVLFVVILLAFLAGMAGAMRDRYGSRSVPPPAT